MVLFCDLDHTLQSSEEPMVLATNLLAVRKWRAAGNKFVITTRHGYSTLDELLPDWQKFVDYAITEDGGAIFTHRSECVYTCPLELRLVRAIQSLVCDRALPMNHGINRCSVELLLGEAIIKLRLYFRTEALYTRYKERIEWQNWPIQLLSHIGTFTGQLPGGTNISQFFGFLDIIPQNGSQEAAVAWLKQVKYPKEQVLAADQHTSESVANLIYQHL